MKPVTIESLVSEAARTRARRTDGFRFCSTPSCDVAYFQPDTGERFLRSDVRVRIGQKETGSPRPVCYCFGHTIEEVESEVAHTGTSRIPDEITEKCRQGLDRCEETNPQGACCLSNVRQALKNAQAKYGATTPQGRKSRMDTGTVVQFGALASAIAASACCWLPLLLIALGVSGGALASTFEAWRPVLLPVTLALLGLAFYFAYHAPRVASAGCETNCCATPETESCPEACCPPHNIKGFAFHKLNKPVLWVVTIFVLAFALFPNYVGYLLRGNDSFAARNDLEKIVVQIDGMTCEACAAGIAASLRMIPGVAAAEVSYEKGQAVIGVPSTNRIPPQVILKAIRKAGDYTGHFLDPEHMKP
ncbi:MAG: cation transporter [Planctomycetia bacterium]|nr:MAG: cation transporter [Planctomycetia bacterium]